MISYVISDYNITQTKLMSALFRRKTTANDKKITSYILHDILHMRPDLYDKN